MEGLEHTKNKLSVEERRNALEQLTQAALIFANEDATDEQKKFAQIARDQSCLTLYGKSWEEAKKLISKDLEDNLPK